jgi:hypothetical protein
MFRIDPKQAVIDHVAGGSTRLEGLSPIARTIAAAPVPETLSAPVVEGVAQLVEAALLLAVGTIIYALMIGFAPAFYLPALVATVLVANVGFNIMRAHRIAAYRRLMPQLARTLPPWIIACGGLAVIIVALRGTDHHALDWLLAWMAAGVITLVAFRIVLNRIVMDWTKAGRLKRRTVIVGGGEPAADLIAPRALAGIGRRRPARRVRRPQRRPLARSSVAGYPKLGASTISSSSRAAPASTS